MRSDEETIQASKEKFEKCLKAVKEILAIEYLLKDGRLDNCKDIVFEEMKKAIFMKEMYSKNKEELINGIRALLKEDNREVYREKKGERK